MIYINEDMERPVMSDLAVCYVALCRGLRDEVVERVLRELKQQQRQLAEQRALIRALRRTSVWETKAYPCVMDGQALVARLHAEHFTLSTFSEQEVYRVYYGSMRTYGASPTLFCWTEPDGVLHTIVTQHAPHLYQVLNGRVEELARGSSSVVRSR